MGFSALQVDEMSLWQLTAQCEAYADANAPKDSRGMSVEQFDALSKDLDEAR